MTNSGLRANEAGQPPYIVVLNQKMSKNRGKKVQILTRFFGRFHR